MELSQEFIGFILYRNSSSLGLTLKIKVICLIISMIFKNTLMDFVIDNIAKKGVVQRLFTNFLIINQIKILANDIMNRN